MSEQKVTHRIRLAMQIHATTIEVFIDDESQFSNGFSLLTRLCNSTKLELAKQGIEYVFDRQNSGVNISSSVTNSVHRVALSILESWPRSKRVLDIQSETGLSEGSVSNILAGRRGNAGNWFQKQDENWTLSNTGISKVLDEVIPAIESGAGQEFPSQ